MNSPQSDCEVCNFVPADIPQIMVLQARCAAAYAGVSVVPGEVYLGPGFDGGKNIFCACWPDGRIAGYAPLYPVLAQAEQPEAAHTLWAEMRIDPALPEGDAVRDLLFARLLARARAVNAGAPGHPCRLTFQYLPSEQPSITYVLSRGARPMEGIFGMRRDLILPLPEVAQPEGVVVRTWRMPTEPEQARYVQAHNEAFPNAPLSWPTGSISCVRPNGL